MGAGIYIHIPFCKQFCVYCDFYSISRAQYKRDFIEALIKEIYCKRDFFREDNRVPTTIYFGGGTPSLLSIAELESIISAIRDCFSLNLEEATIEVNPNDISLEYAKGLKRLGFNRVSMGVQSFNDSHLKWMNRRHTVLEAVDSFSILRDVGFKNISIDLIYGYPILQSKEWIATIERAIELNPNHISAYQMTVERGTKLYKMIRDKELDSIDEDIAAEQFFILQERLNRAGYMMYEISNFALGNNGEYESKHNNLYWAREPYLGLGPAAHSFKGDTRWANISNLTKYIDYFNNNRNVVISTKECLTQDDIYNEIIMVGLRRAKGVKLNDISNILTNKDKYSIDREIQLGNIIVDGEYIKIPSNKLFISDGIIVSLMR